VTARRDDRRRLVLLRACAAALLLGGAVVAAAAPGPAPRAAPRPAARHAASDCGACHVESSWSEVRFDHARTGFPLRDAHLRVSCRGCHRQDFKAAIPDACSGCHRDRHAGQLGLHCEGCHSETDWRALLLGADGHRSTSFPLTGRHAAIACTECHGDLRDRSFANAPLACVACHRADYDGAAARSADHVALGFGTDCQSCHDTWTFFPARFDAHDICFRVWTGSHRPVRCSQCHPSTAGLTFTGACSATVTCTSCHAHTCARSDQQHTSVMGYACLDQKCYQCHKQSGR
jgi:hypothetical protein